MTECIIYEKSRRRGKRSVGRAIQVNKTGSGSRGRPGAGKEFHKFLKRPRRKNGPRLPSAVHRGQRASLLFQISTRQFAVVKLYFICGSGDLASRSRWNNSPKTAGQLGNQVFVDSRQPRCTPCTCPPSFLPRRDAKEGRGRTTLFLRLNIVPIATEARNGLDER